MLEELRTRWYIYLALRRQRFQERIEARQDRAERAVRLRQERKELKMWNAVRRSVGFRPFKPYVVTADPYIKTKPFKKIRR